MTQKSSGVVKRSPPARSRKRSVTAVSTRTGIGIQVQLVPLATVVPSALNPRRRRVNIEELAASIQADGLLQPVFARVRTGKYEVTQDIAD